MTGQPKAARRPKNPRTEPGRRRLPAQRCLQGKRLRLNSGEREHGYTTSEVDDLGGVLLEQSVPTRGGGDLWLAPMIGGVGMVGAIFAIGLMGWLGPVLRLPSTPLCCVQDDPSTPLLFAQGEPGGVGLWRGLRL